MRRILCLSCLLTCIPPAMAETTPAAGVTLPPALARVLDQPEITPGHAMALGAGLFTGAVLGSALITGGAVAAVIGGAAGLATGHWVWSRQAGRSD